MSGRDPSRGRSQRRGKAMGKAWSNTPVTPPPPGTEGQPRRLLEKRRTGGSTGTAICEAIAWAKTRDWWPLVRREQPYGDARYWIFLLREEEKL